MRFERLPHWLITVNLLGACHYSPPWDPLTVCTHAGATIYHEAAGAHCARDALLLDRAVCEIVDHRLASAAEMTEILEGREIWVYATDAIDNLDPTITRTGYYHAGWPGHPIELARRQTELAHELIHAIREERRGISNDDEFVHRSWCWRQNSAGQCLTSEEIRDATGDGEIAIPAVCSEFAAFAWELSQS